jgi:hypothetical protein
MDVFSTQALNRVVEELPLNPAFLLNMFFPGVETSDTETIMFDHVTGTRRLSPFVAHNVEGQVVDEVGFETAAFKPAYIKDKRVFDPGKQFKRRAGEKIGGSLTPDQRLNASIAWHLVDQLDMWKRRREVMAGEVLSTGKLTIVGEKYPRKIVDFKRDPRLTFALTGSDVWNTTGLDPFDAIERYAELLWSISFTRPTDAIMTPDVWGVIRRKISEKNAANSMPTAAATMMMQRLDTDSRTVNDITLKLGALVVGGEGAALVGVLDTGNGHKIRLWVYNDSYNHPETGAETPILAPGTFLLGSTSLDGVQHFGAIKDLKAGLQARPYFVKSWEEEDPSVRYILGQSAPLLVPYRKNAFLSAKVI